MKKVILITPSLNMGGAEIMCENLANALVKTGVNLKIVSLYSQKTIISNRLENNGIEVVYLGKKRGLDISMIGKLCKLFAKEKPDVVHSHNNSIQYVIPAAILAKVKGRVHTVHSIAEKELIKPVRIIAKLFYKRFNVVPVALSEAVRDTVADEYRLPVENIPVIFNGINLSNCIVKTDYSVSGSFKILHIGRFEPVKNHAMLVKAFKMFHKRYPNSVLQLIGDGSERQNIERMVTELQLTDCVEFLGIQSNVYGYLHDADVFTLPSVYEGIPMTLIEAMGTGLPIVATRVGGIPNMFEDQESAILIEPQKEELFCTFEKLYLSESLRKSLGEQAKEKSSRFSYEKMAEKYLSVYIK